MTPLHREQVREAVARGDVPSYAIEAYIEAAEGDARTSQSPRDRADALQFAADLCRVVAESFEPLDYIPVQDGIREAL